MLILSLVFPVKALAVVDPALVPNNKVGIHLINANTNEVQEADSLVNSSGGSWGYVTVIIGSDDRKHDKWQAFFDDLRRSHLIPIVRLATQAQGDNWKRPYDMEEQAWADFLDSLNWPVQNRYVVVFNEPNHGQEWGGSVDAKSYAETLDKYIKALKSKSGDFFVLNAGLDASAPQALPGYEDEYNFLSQMNQAVPGIFDELDGWASHSYPTNYIGSPDDSGRATVGTWQWELNVLKGLGLKKSLEVFITETGWKHSEGLVPDDHLPSSDQVGGYFQEAFKASWNNPQIVVITPFLLDYQQPPFDHFSFRKLESALSNLNILGEETQGNNPLASQFYPQYQSLVSLGKTQGQPSQVQKGEYVDGGVYSGIVSGESYTTQISFKNTGESIWGDGVPFKLTILDGGGVLNLSIDPVSSSEKIEPGQKYSFKIRFRSPDSGKYSITLAVFNGSVQVTPSITFPTEVKSPVILQTHAKLSWKSSSAGEYLLSVISDVATNTRQIILNSQGSSDKIEARDLLPDYTFQFTLNKPFYKSKTLTKTVHSGVNDLDFGELSPDLPSAILNPRALWSLLPWSN